MNYDIFVQHVSRLFNVVLVLSGFASFALATPTLLVIPSGTAQLGSLDGEADERPVRRVPVAAFRLSRTEVANRDFDAFVQATHYMTQAETRGWGWVWTDRWRQVQGANWRHPQGADSHIRNRPDHPVVQVSGNTRLGAATGVAIPGAMRPRALAAFSEPTMARTLAARPMRKTAIASPRRSDAIRAAPHLLAS